MNKKRYFVLVILGLLIIENLALGILFLCSMIACIMQNINPILVIFLMFIFFALTGLSAFAFVYVFKNNFSVSKEERERLANEKRERKIQAKREKLQAKIDELKK